MRCILISLVFAALFSVAGAAGGESLESFESSDMPGVKGLNTVWERVQKHATDGQWALKCLYEGQEKDTWPGMSVPLEGAVAGQARALAVDVYNPSDKERVLNYRIDTADGGKTFGSMPLAPGKTTGFRAPFSKAGAAHRALAIESVFVYVSKPREDVTLYLDNLRVVDDSPLAAKVAAKPTATPRPVAAPKLDMGSVIESFEKGDSPYAQASGGAKGRRERKHASDGKWACRIDIAGNEKDTWPGLAIRIPGLKVQRTGSLVMDVTNPGPDAVRVATRLNAEGGVSGFCSTVSIPVGRKKSLVVPLAQLGAKNYGKMLTQVFPYVSKPRKNATLYFDNIRLVSGEQTLARAAYVEFASASAPDREDEAFGAIVFRRDALAHVFRNSRPWPGERAESVRTFAAKGEAQPFGLSFYALRDVGDATLEVSALRGESGALPGSAAEVSVVRFLHKRFSYSSEEYIADVPVYAEEGNRFAPVPRGESRTFWVRLRVPETANAGVYRGEMTLAMDGRKRAIPLIVRVLPFSLPEPKGYLIGEYYRLSGKAGSEDWRKAVAADLRDQRDHGMTTVGWCGGVGVKGGEAPEAFFRDDSPFGFLVKTYMDIGFPEPLLTLNDFGQKYARTVAAYGTAEYDAAYKRFWTEWVRIRGERGWPELIVQPVDEPGWKGDDEKDRNVHLLKLLKQVPGMRTEQDGPGDNYFHKLAGPWADVWNYNGGVPDFEKVREIGKERIVTFYNNDVESYRPEVDRYATGFFQKASGIRGVFNWEYRGGRGDLYNDLDGTGGDWVHNYPKGETEGGGPSLAWEASREGVDDLKYVVLLEEWIARARKKGGAAAEAAKRAEADLADLLHSLEAKPRVRSRAQWTVTLKKDQAPEALRDPKAGKFVGGRLRQPNGWTLPDYDRARWRVAGQIVGLMEACGANADAAAAAASGAPEVRYLGQVEFPTVRVRTQAARTSKPTHTIPRLSRAPQVDGAPDEAVWQEGLEAAPFVSHTGGDPMPVQTRARIGWHGETLYVAVWCDEPNMGGIVDRVVEDGEPTWTDDCVEIFIDPGRSGYQWAQLVVNSRGTQWSTWGGDRPWSAVVPTDATKGKNRWRVEAALPLGEFLRGSGDLGLNICRERRAGGSLELSSWQRTGGRFATPARFAHVRLENATQLVASLPEVAPEQPLKLHRPGAMVVGRDVWTCELEWAGAPEALQGASVRLGVFSAGKSVARLDVPGPVPAWARHAFFVSGLEPGDCEMRFEIRDGAGKVLGERKAPVRSIAGTREMP